MEALDLILKISGVISIVVAGITGGWFFVMNIIGKKWREKRSEIYREEQRLTEALKARVDILDAEVQELKERLRQQTDELKTALIQNNSYKDIILEKDNDTKLYRQQVKVHMEEVRQSLQISKENAKKIKDVQIEIQNIAGLLRDHIKKINEYLLYNKEKEVKNVT